MTREEFDEISTYDELYEIDSDEGIYAFDDWEVASSDRLNDYVWDEINRWDDGWVSLGDFLQNIDTGYDWYSFYDSMPAGLYDGDSIFNDLKDAIKDSLESNGFFEESSEVTDSDEKIEDFSIEAFMNTLQ